MSQKHKKKKTKKSTDKYTITINFITHIYCDIEDLKYLNINGTNLIRKKPQKYVTSDDEDYINDVCICPDSDDDID